MIRILNGYEIKIRKLLTPLFKKEADLQVNYETANTIRKTRCSRYAVLQQVLDAETRQPIANATVHFPEQNQTRHTSSTGRLWIRKFPMGTHKLIISHPNYLDCETHITLTNFERGKSGKIYLTPKEEVIKPGEEKEQKGGNESGK